MSYYKRSIQATLLDSDHFFQMHIAKGQSRMIAMMMLLHPQVRQSLTVTGNCEKLP